MNLHQVHMTGYGPTAWNHDGCNPCISINIHSAKRPEKHSGIRINPETHAMAEARGDYHEIHNPVKPE